MSSLGVLADPASCDTASTGRLLFHNLVPVRDQISNQEMLKKGPKVFTIALDGFFALHNMSLVNFLIFCCVGIVVLHLTEGFLLSLPHGNYASNFFVILTLYFDVSKKLYVAQSLFS